MGQQSCAQVGRRVAALTTALLVAGGGMAFAVGIGALPAQAVDGGITGTVFNDVNFNGVRDGASGNIAAEPPVGGVGVTATDAGGTVWSTTTKADGTYDLNVSGATSSDVRVTFTPPAGYDDGAHGGASGSTVQFVKIPGGVANVGLTQVGQFNTDADPFVVVPIERTSAVLWDADTVYPGLPALEGFPYSQHGREGDANAPATPPRRPCSPSNATPGTRGAARRTAPRPRSAQPSCATVHRSGPAALVRSTRPMSPRPSAATRTARSGSRFRTRG